ncbi:hypothetical protein [Caulobacter sp. LARHSG274]
MSTYPLKIATDDYERLRKSLVELAPNTNPILIGVDGLNGAGKTHLANWIGWQFGIPALHLDLYNNHPGWLTDELARTAKVQLDHHRSVVVEGVRLLDAIQAAHLGPPTYYVYAECVEEMNELPSVTEYTERRATEIAKADYRLTIYLPSSD